MQYITNYESMIGTITLASDGENLTGLWIKNQKYFAKTLEKEYKENDNLEIFKDTKKWLNEYFAGTKPNPLDLKLKPSGTEFQKLIWQILLKIPYGEVRTYKEIAEKVEKINKKRTSPRAVGGAIGKNQISIIIPCHRVVGKNKKLTGYAGGIDKKIKLLEHEGVNLDGYK